MHLTLLKSKLHRATVTHSEVDYEGSCAIDRNLLDTANILPYEQIEIYNITNGERFTPYAIEAERNSGIISVNGAAAHRASPGDLVIICSYAVLDQSEAAIFHPTLVYLDEKNQVKKISERIAMQVA